MTKDSTDDFADLQGASNPDPNVTNVACTGPNEAIEMLQRFSLSQKPLVNGLCILRCYMIYMY